MDSWNVSRVTGLMESMFRGASDFNQNLSSWNTTGERDFSCRACSRMPPYGFNQDISEWDITSVTSATGMLDPTALIRTSGSGI